jgi:CMP-N-acetylneuraminic acid synthetase
VTTSFLGIIPARGGSKGVPRKNARLVAGRPLLEYTVEAARASRRLTGYAVSTEDEEIASLARSLGCPVVVRPADLARDETPMVPVMIHAVEECQKAGTRYDYAVLLQPTSPLRTAQDIDSCAELAACPGTDAVVSVTSVPGHYHPDWQFIIQDGRLALYSGRALAQTIARRQLLGETYTRNGAIYVVRVGLLIEERSLFGANTVAYVMPDARSVNIDSERDLAMAECLLRSR